MIKNVIAVIFAITLAVSVTFAEGETDISLEKQVKEAVPEGVTRPDALALDAATASLYQIWDSEFHLVTCNQISDGVQYQISDTGDQVIETWKYIYNIDTVIKDLDGNVLNDDKNFPYDLYSRYEFNTTARSFAFRVEPYDYWNQEKWDIYFWLMAQNRD